MKITSMDVHRKEFGHAVRGYREDEVDDFLDAVAVELDRLHAQIEELADLARQSESQAINFEAERNTINNALLTAQRASDEVLEQAKEKSQKLLEEADSRAEKTLLAARQEKESLLAEIAQLKTAEEKFRADILGNAQTVIDHLRAVNVPAVAATAAVAAAPVIPVAVEEFDVQEDLELEEEFIVDEQPVVPAHSAAAAPVAAQVVPVAAAPAPIAPAEGLGQYGEMELDEDLETLD